MYGVSRYNIFFLRSLLQIFSVWVLYFCAETFLPILFIVFLCVYGIRRKCMSTKNINGKWVEESGKKVYEIYKI